MKTIKGRTTNLSVNEIFDKVASIASELFDIDKEDIKMESLLEEDLGADGLDIVELIMNLEMEFGIILPDEAFLPNDLQETDTDNDESLDEDDDEDYTGEEVDDDNSGYTVSEPYTLTIADYVTFIQESLSDVSD